MWFAAWFGFVGLLVVWWFSVGFLLLLILVCGCIVFLGVGFGGLLWYSFLVWVWVFGGFSGLVGLVLVGDLRWFRRWLGLLFCVLVLFRCFCLFIVSFLSL